MSEHAPLAPSSAEQWGNCAGSYRAQLGMPDESTPAAREGTATHWMIEQVLRSHRSGVPVSPASFEGTPAPNGVVLDQRAVEGAEVFVEHVLATCAGLGGLDGLMIEQRVSCPTIHPDVWGTLDVAVFCPALNLLLVWDYKHGRLQCDAEGNKQLVCYLEGLKTLFSINGAWDQQINVVARIVQPFCYRAGGPIDEWHLTLSDIRATVNTLASKATEALGDDPKLNAGGWCRHCTAIVPCTAARTAGYGLTTVVDAPYQMDVMPGAALATERAVLQDAVALAKARLQAIEDELTHRVEQGDTSCGLTLSTTKGREQFQVPDEQIIALCGALGVDATKPSLKTPKQVRDSAAKEVRPLLEAAFKKVVSRKPGSRKLTPISESSVSKAFKSTTG